jgi:tricorn protease
MAMKTKLLVLLAAFWALVAFAQGAPSHLMRYADIHGDKVVFTYEGDLWLASASGGDARRLTSDPGEERYAKFSPDGTKIAFTAQYDGGADVYVMDAEGGVPERLTWYPSANLVLGWTPDGKGILFRSRREWPNRGEQVYVVMATGGTEKKLPVDRAGLASFSPDGRSLAYNRLGGETRTWKRHQGGDAQKIWMGNLEKGDFHEISPSKGADNYPMWWGNGIYFASDRDFGTVNIFRYDVSSGEVRRLTSYKDYDVKYPSLGDGQIIYQLAETLHVLDLKTEKERQLDIRMPSDRVRVRADWMEASANTGVFGLSPDGKRLLLESRGEVLSIPAEKEKGATYNLTRTSGSREKDPAWSPDGKWVAFFSDKTGEDEVYLADARGEGEWKQLTSGNTGFRMRLVWSPDSKYLLFTDKFMKLNLLDVASKALKVVDQGEYDDGWERWGIQDYTWTPDSKWIAYTKKVANTNEVILLYSMETGKITPVTDEMTQSWSPSFDPKGRYLYFLSNRSYAPTMGVIDQDHIFLNMTTPYIVVLKDGAPSPFAAESDEAPAAEKAAAKDKKSEEKPAQPTVEIDLAGIQQRIIPAEGVEPGMYFHLEATEKGFLYLAQAEPGFENRYPSVTDTTDGKYDLKAYNLDEKESSDGIKGINNYHLSFDHKKLVYRASSKFGVIDASGKGKIGDGVVDLSDAKFKIERLPEFTQMFNEAWRIERDWFYDKNMQGTDWPAMREKYAKFLPDCGNRSDLSYLIGEMIGELNAGHTYVYGGDFGAPGKRVGVGLLGCDFSVEEGTYPRVTKIYAPRDADAELRSPLCEPGCGIKEGDYIIAVDGQKASSKENIYALFENKAGKVVTLLYNSKPSPDGAKSYRVRTLKNDMDLRYRAWVDANRAYVDKLSRGRVGYIHIPDMGEEGLKEFARQFYPQFDKPALLIDVRYNGGGFTGDMIMERLERKVWAMTQPREGKPAANPEIGVNAHLALLLNEDTGSNGEFFSEAWKIKGLGKVFGMRTWGGSVGIEPHEGLVDGGTVTPPQFGLYGLDGKWLIEGRGVDPEVVVQNMPGDVLKGKDAQLDATLHYLLEQLQKDPKSLPLPPPYPNKARPQGSDLSGRQ